MILFGASGHAKVIIDILEKSGLKVNRIYDDHPKCDDIFGVPVLSSAAGLQHGTDALISIGNNRFRMLVAEKYRLNYIVARHPSSVVSAFAEIGEGSVVMAGAVINPGASVGRHCIINTNAVVEHDCVLEDFVHISPGASLAGNVCVEQGAHVGIGASVIQGIRIGAWSTVGAGAVVVRDVPAGATVVGVPAKVK